MDSEGMASQVQSSVNGIQSSDDLHSELAFPIRSREFHAHQTTFDILGALFSEVRFSEHSVVKIPNSVGNIRA